MFTQTSKNVFRICASIHGLPDSQMHSCFFFSIMLQMNNDDETSSFFVWLWTFTLDKKVQIFFLLMFVTTFRSCKLYEVSNAWHSRWWALKFVILMISMSTPFFMRVAFIRLYGMHQVIITNRIQDTKAFHFTTLKHCRFTFWSSFHCRIYFQ